MGLLSTEVEVGLGSKNIKWYEEKGYSIPRKNGAFVSDEKIVVKTKDLKRYSHVRVQVSCDECNNIFNLSYCTYNKNCERHDGKYYCHACSHKLFASGVNHPSWKDDKPTDIRILQRNYPEYTQFIKRVLARDNYTCKCCGRKTHDIEVHHLDGYNWCEEKRTDDTNGITLCKKCHDNFHSKYGNGDNTREQFEEWYGSVIPKLQKYNGILPDTREIYDYEDDIIYHSAKDFAKKYNIKNYSDVYRHCNRQSRNTTYYTEDGNKHIVQYKLLAIKGHHLFWLDEYENMSEDEILEIVNMSYSFSTKIICKTTGKIFNTIKDGSIYYKINKTGISACCRGRYKSSGKLPDGTKLQWMYYEDFLKLPKEEQNEILSRNQELSEGNSFIMQ